MRHLLYVVSIMVIMMSSCSTDRVALVDYLVYVVNGRHLMYFDPATKIHTPILVDWEINNVSISAKNRLAFTSSHEGDSDVYILEYPFTDHNPVNISRDPSAKDYVVSWSPDGRYLAYISERGDENTLSVWDGHRILPVRHFQKAIRGVVWSMDGRLAFTEIYTFIFPYEGDPSEVFVWDGGATTSVSQNPSGNDGYSEWETKGQLAFQSERNGEYDIYVWDGVSKKNGVPDISTYKNIAPDLTGYYSSPSWTNTGSLTFGAFGPEDDYMQIYEWDGQTAINISQNPGFHNGNPSWRNDGYWSFATFFSNKQLMYIRDNTNKTLLVTEGQYSSAWSQSGFLVFCVPDLPEWTLSMWDGKSIVKIAHGDSVSADWRNGADVSCGN